MEQGTWNLEQGPHILPVASGPAPLSPVSCLLSPVSYASAVAKRKRKPFGSRTMKSRRP